MHFAINALCHVLNHIQFDTRKFNIYDQQNRYTINCDDVKCRFEYQIRYSHKNFMVSVECFI